ncbi:unnamed protein product, partial [Pylaiella littoralis]
MIVLVRGEGPVSSPIVIYVDVNTLLRVQVSTMLQSMICRLRILRHRSPAMCGFSCFVANETLTHVAYQADVSAFIQAICSGPRTAVGVSVRAADRPGPLAVEHVPEADAERGEPGDANASPGRDSEGDGVVGGSAAGGRSALVCIPARAADTP